MNSFQSIKVNCRKLITLWLAIFTTSYSISATAQIPPEIESLFEQSKYREIIDILLPEARKGNNDAMYFISKALIRQSSEGDNLKKAKLVATKCANNGDLRCKSILDHIDLALARSDVRLKLADNRIWLKEGELENIHKKILELNPTVNQQHSAENPKLKAFYFFNEFGSELSSLVAFDQSFNHSSLNIEIQYYFEMDPTQKNTAFLKPTPNISIPAQGFIPDPNMSFAKQYGIAKVPTIVFFTRDGVQYNFSSVLEFSNFILNQKKTK